MKLNHLDLQVADVQQTVTFFERYFDLELRTSRASPALAVLSDRQGFVLVIQRRKHDGEAYPRASTWASSSTTWRASTPRMLAPRREGSK